MGQPVAQSNVSTMVFMLLSAMLTAFFAGLFYDAYWRWLPFYAVSGVEPIWWVIYADPLGLLIIPTGFFLITTLYYYLLTYKQRS